MGTSASTTSAESADFEPPGWISPVELVVFATLIATLVIYATPWHRLGMLLVALGSVVVIHVISTVVVGRAFGLPLREVGLFLGGAILRMRIGGIWLKVGWFPIGGYARFAARVLDQPGVASPGDRTWDEIHPLKRCLSALSGAAGLLLFACVLIGIESTAKHFLSAPGELFGALFRGKAESLFRTYIAVLDSNNFTRSIGLLAVKNAFFELLPIPMLSGGIALWHALNGVLRGRINPRMMERAQVISILPTLLIAIWLVVGLVRAWDSSNS